MIFLAFLTGGLAGLWVRHYFLTLPALLSREVYENYIEIFPENPPHFQGHSKKLPPIKCGRIARYFLVAGSVFALFYYFSSFYVMVLLGIVLLCCWTISVTDWYYQLISPGLCQLLLAAAIVSAWQGIGFVSLDDALKSAVLAWSIFYSLFHIARVVYHQEVFGRGDYWLITALAAFVQWQELPLFILLSCLFSLIYVSWHKRKKRFIPIIPFGPFLCSGMTVVLGKNWLISIICQTAV